jgi:hypothetical protein
VEEDAGNVHLFTALLLLFRLKMKKNVKMRRKVAISNNPYGGLSTVQALLSGFSV